MKERMLNIRRARKRLIKLNKGSSLLKQNKERLTLFNEYHECYKEGWEDTFVGCCHDIDKKKDTCFDDSADALTTQFNVTALVPSLKRLYVDLWDAIELSMLGYYDTSEEETVQQPQHRGLLYPTDTHHSQYPVPAIMRILKTSVLPEIAEYLYFVVGFKPLATSGERATARRRRRRDGGVIGPVLSRRLSDTDVSSSNTDDNDGASPKHLQSTSNISLLDEINSLRDTATNMSAWKLACFLRQRRVGCLRCSICDRIDLMVEFEDSNCSPTGTEEESTRNQRGRSPFLRNFQKQIGVGNTWMTPCNCPELVHRRCLEEKLKLVPKYEPFEKLKIHLNRVWSILVNSSRRKTHDPTTSAHESNIYTIAPRVWISYDNTIPIRHGQAEEDSVVAIDHLGRFCSPVASCQTCGCRYVRTVRLPRNKWEVLVSSLSDPTSLIRAASTFAHFLLVSLFIAACEGICPADECTTHRSILTTSIGVLKWPTTGLNGVALAFWQLQQTLMLHIFFSPRFANIVDRLWLGPISMFYCRLYFYFIVTSALLSASYIPMVSRTIRRNVLEVFASTQVLDFLQPAWSFVALVNLFQYAIVSTTVICIFWRTHYRIFTVADGKEAAVILQRRRELLRNREVERQNINRFDPANHPMYHGPW